MAARILRSHMVPILMRRARRLGIKVDDFGVDDADEVRITCSASRDLCDEIARRAGDPLFGFHAALEMPRGAYGLVEYVVRNTPTVRALAVQLVRFSRLINAQLVTRFDERKGVLEERIHGEPACLGKQGNEFSLVHQTNIVQSACGKRLALDRVMFAHSAPAMRETELAEFFGTTTIDYDCGYNGVVMSNELLSTPLAQADASLFRVLEARAAEIIDAYSDHDELAAVRRAIAAELEAGEPTAKHVAKVMGSSERTLHRKIGAHGTTFGKLVDDLRHELAIAHLADGARSVTDVALLLGYSDGRAFARAFRRWTKKTPRSWRRDHRATT